MRSGKDLADAGWHAVGSEVVSAVDTEEICRPRAAVAVTAGGRNLAGALGAEVIVALNARAAGRATGYEGLGEEEVEHGADAGRHDKTDEHPNLRAHHAAGCVLADITDHQHIQ